MPKATHFLHHFDWTPVGDSGMIASLVQVACHPLAHRAQSRQVRHLAAMQSGTDKLWSVVNERDHAGPRLVDHMVLVQQGGFSGWPWYYIGHKENRHGSSPIQ